MTTKFYYDEVRGLRGLINSGDDRLEQIRMLQLEISPRRRVGKTVLEFRTILEQRLSDLSASPWNFPDSLLTILRLRDEKKAGSSTDETPVEKITVVGMISMTIEAGQAYTEAKIGDPIVRTEFRGRNMSQQLIEHCHEIAEKMKVSRCYAPLSVRRASVMRPFFEAAGYTESGKRVLEFRFKSEG